MFLPLSLTILEEKKIAVVTVLVTQVRNLFFIHGVHVVMRRQKLVEETMLISLAYFSVRVEENKRLNCS